MKEQIFDETMLQNREKKWKYLIERYNKAYNATIFL